MNRIEFEFVYSPNIDIKKKYSIEEFRLWLDI